MKGVKAVTQGVILTLAAIGQIVCAILFYNKNGSTTITNIGWVVLWISAAFGWLPILTFKKWGSVPKGQSYMKTTVLVDKGVYAIVRHPQYLAGILIAIGLTLVAQHWLVGTWVLIVIAIDYHGYFSGRGIRYPEVWR